MKISNRFQRSFIIGCAFVLIACGNQNGETSSNIDTEKAGELEIDTLPPLKMKRDTMTLVAIDDNADYWSAFFNTGDSVEQFVYNLELNNDLVGSILSVEWKMDTLFEAGEESRSYKQKRLLDYKVVKKAETFQEFLGRFAKAYTDTAMNLAPFKSDEIGYNIAWNMGVACMLGTEPPGLVSAQLKSEYKIANKLPEGDFCEGYDQVQDGFYFDPSQYISLPSFAKYGEDGDFVEVTPELPLRYRNNAIRKVIVIMDEWHYAYLYFVWVEGGWKLWIENVCDCSA